MTTSFYFSPEFALHAPVFSHPERPARLEAVERHVRGRGLWKKLAHRDFEPATEADLQMCHSAEMIERVRGASSTGASLDPDTYTTRDSWRVGLLSAGASLAAAREIASGYGTQAFVASRPPGHHATSGQSMGFCLFNNAALAAREARKYLGRVAVLDWDVHHGNGTQDIFYADPSVYFASLHQWPLYPGTGAAEERGEGEAMGTTRNIPLPAGTGDAEYLEAWRSLGSELEAFAPEAIIVSAGFDAHREDPIGGMAVTEDGFAQMARQAKEWAAQMCQGRLLLVLEGGYNVEALGRSVAQVLEEITRDS